MNIPNVNNNNDANQITTVNTRETQKNITGNQQENENPDIQTDNYTFSEEARGMFAATQNIREQECEQNEQQLSIQEEPNPGTEITAQAEEIPTATERPEEAVENEEPNEPNNRRLEQPEVNRALTQGTQNQNPMLDLIA